MVRRERREPVQGEVVDPDYQHGAVDREKPEHEDQNRVRVVVEVEVSRGTRLAG